MVASWQATIRGNAILTALPRMTEQPFYLVGGAMRDVLRGETRIKDWDIVFPRNALTIARRFADTIGGTFVTLRDDPPLARVVQAGRQYDISQYHAGAETLEEDLWLRDFTVNALAADLRMVLLGANIDAIDPSGGVSDIAAGALRPCAPNAFQADPLRAIRLYRFVAMLSYTPTVEAETLAAAAGPLLRTVAPEQITDELARLFAAPGAAPAIAGLVRGGLWENLVPEATAGRGMQQSENHHLDVFDHDLAASMAVVDFLNTIDDWATPEADTFRAWLDTPIAGERTRRWIVVLAALLHDAAKPAVRTVGLDGTPQFARHEQAGGNLAARIAERLHLSPAEHDLLIVAIRQHARPNDLPERGPDAPLRLMAILGDAAPACIMVAMGDRATAQGPHRPPEKVQADILFLQSLLRDYFARYAPLLATPPLVTGTDLMRPLGLHHGNALNLLLLRLRGRQLRGTLATPEEALRLAATLA